MLRAVGSASSRPFGSGPHDIAFTLISLPEDHELASWNPWLPTQKPNWKDAGAGTVGGKDLIGCHGFRAQRWAISI